MANGNVRFYKLATLPSFDENKKGIFVHVTSKLIRLGKEGAYTYTWGELGNDAITKIVIQKIEARSIFVPEWMKLKRLNTVESGLWFGGENGWELLSNDTTSGAIDAAIDAKINALDVDGYAQAVITTDTPAEGEPNSSTLTIKGIKEVDGKIGIPDSENLNLKIAIDGVYSQSNKIATQSTVTTAINGLNVDTIQTVDKTTSGNTTTLTFKGVKETNGVIAQGTGNETLTVGDAKLNIQIGSTTIENVFSANAQSDGAIKLNENVFKKDGDVISVITPTAVSESNKLVTQQDIANISGAMHYKGSIASDTNWPSPVKAGDVYIATGNFVKDGNTIESGDLIVFNSATLTDYKVVQSNITLGTGDEQIAKNDGALTNGNLVVATSEGIKTIGITETQLTGTDNNKRELSYRNGTPDTDTTNNITLYHDVTIKDAFTVIGKDFTETINISSTNRSIKIARNAGENDSTGVMVDLVWNTTMDPDPNN